MYRIKIKWNRFKLKVKRKVFKDRYVNMYAFMIPRIHKNDGDGHYDEYTAVFNYKDRRDILKKCEEVDCFYQASTHILDKDEVKDHKEFAMGLEETLNALNDKREDK